MNTIPHKFFHRSAGVRFLVLAFLSWSAVDSHAECSRYSVQIVQPASCGILGPPPIMPWGIDSLGRICGDRQNCNGDGRAFWWDGINLVTLPLLPGAFDGRATALNMLGQVVGYSTDGGIRGFLFQDGQLTELFPAPGHVAAQIHSINENGAIVGQSNVKACLWLSGSPNLLTLPIGPSSVANDINDKNQIVGWMGVATGPPWASEAFLWDNGTVTPLGFLNGATNSLASAINNNTEIVGRIVLPNPNGTGFLNHGFLWSDGKMIDIGTLPGADTCWPYDINDAGQIVGASYAAGDRSLISVGFIWQNGVMRALQGLVVPVPGLMYVQEPFAINNAGQITGTGTVHLPEYGDVSVAVILTPIRGLPGDVDCDQLVNVNDLLQVIHRWHETGGPADLNHDGIVNRLDLMIVIENWSF